MNKTFLVIATIVGSTAFMPVASVMAAGSVTPTPTKTPTPTPIKSVEACQTTYGGGSTCETTQLLLDKTVKNPKSTVYVDNLGTNDPKYNPDGTVSFKLKVTNTGASTLSKVTVTDTLPDFVTFTDGDAKVHTFTLDDLKPNESRIIDISAKIATSNALPNDKGITCVTNSAKATSDSLESTDTAQFCVEKSILSTTKGGNVVYPVPAAKTTPPTGPEALALVGLLPTSMLGFVLRKKALLK